MQRLFEAVYEKTVLKNLLRIPLLICVSSLPVRAVQERDSNLLQQEEVEDYYNKWLKEDVRYIIADEERAVFEQLTTAEEKEQFIEQFWFRRDPNPLTAENEYKEEHYRRIAYANEHFRSGKPGWLTDRGRIYIIHGPPADIETYAGGGSYNRPLNEGGGTTTTYPFEVWRYRHIEALGSDIILEFIDPSFSGEYRLARHPDEKDALLHVPGAGLTIAEETGMAQKMDRPYFTGDRDYLYSDRLARDNPFERYERYARVQGPAEVKYKDLKELVDVDISFSSLTMQVHEDYFRLNKDRALVPVTLQFPNSELSFKEQEGTYLARLAVYGIVTSLSNRVVAEFEDDLLTSYSRQNIDSGLQESSIYQKILALDLNNRYKLDLILKDLNSEKVGVVSKALIPPSFTQEGLQTSTVILSNSIQQLAEVPDSPEMFVLGDIKIRPSLDREFASGSSLGVYFHTYNFGVDQATLKPSLRIAYSVLKDGKLVSHGVDETDESLQFYSGRRAVIVSLLGLEDFEPGEYQLKVEVTDRLTHQSVLLEEDFVVAIPKS